MPTGAAEFLKNCPLVGESPAWARTLAASGMEAVAERDTGAEESAVCGGLELSAVVAMVATMSEGKAEEDPAPEWPDMADTAD